MFTIRYLYSPKGSKRYPVYRSIPVCLRSNKCSLNLRMRHPSTEEMSRQPAPRGRPVTLQAMQQHTQQALQSST